MSFFKVYFKDIFSICFGHDFEIFNFSASNKRKIILISSASKSNFYKDGSYTDRYFQINSKDFKNIIFYLDYLDKDLPERLDENIVLFRLKKLLY